MNLYVTLQTILEKIRQNKEEVAYATGECEMIRRVLDNQERLSEQLLVIGSLLQALIEKEIEIELKSSKDDKKH